MIKVTYDKVVDAKYITIKSGDFYETKILNEWLFADVNVEGSILGIEILDYSKRVFSIETLNNELICINIFDNVSNYDFSNVIMSNRGQYVNSSETVTA